MIFQTTKAIKEKLDIKSQQGVTLLLAILLLGAILSISFSLATVLFIQVRTSGDLAKTEAALYGAQGLGEQALFNTTRQVTNPSYVSNFNNSVTLNGAPVTSSTSTPVFQDKVTANTTFAGTPNVYNFCSSTAGVTSGNSGCGYGKVNLTYLATGNTDPLEVYFCQFNPNSTYATAPCTATSTNAYWITGSNSSIPDSPNNPNGTVMSPTGVSTLTWATTTSALDPNMQQELILYTTSPNPIYISIQTFDAAGNPKGLPLLAKTSVSVNALNGQTSRKIQVVVPNNYGHSATVNPPEYPLQAVWNHTANGPFYGSLYNMGYSFTPSKPGKITQLWMYVSDSFTNTVYLYDNTGAVLATASIAGSPGAWASANITPVNVSSGITYTVSVRYSLTVDGYYSVLNTSGGLASGNVVINSGKWSAASSNSMPTNLDNANVYGLVDITFIPN